MIERDCEFQDMVKSCVGQVLAFKEKNQDVTNFFPTGQIAADL